MGANLLKLDGSPDAGAVRVLSKVFVRDLPLYMQMQKLDTAEKLAGQVLARCPFFYLDELDD